RDCAEHGAAMRADRCVRLHHAPGRQDDRHALPQGRQAHVQRDRSLFECHGGSTPDVRKLPRQDRGQGERVSAVIVYRAVPYLLLAAPPAIFLLTVLLGSCTMARSPEVTADRARFYSDPN